MVRILVPVSTLVLGLLVGWGVAELRAPPAPLMKRVVVIEPIGPDGTSRIPHNLRVHCIREGGSTHRVSEPPADWAYGWTILIEDSDVQIEAIQD